MKKLQKNREILNRLILVECQRVEKKLNVQNCSYFSTYHRKYQQFNGKVSHVKCVAFFINDDTDSSKSTPARS